MRIDLHTHTQKLKQGDNPGRIISPEKYVEKMRNNDVKICSITNHNKFDIEEYNSISKIDPELVIFPGIELDVIKKTETGAQKFAHIILIASPRVKEKFYEKFDNEVERNYDIYNLQYDKLIEKVKTFSRDEIIIIPHFADKDRAISGDLNDPIKHDLSDYVVILEPAKLKTMGIINSHEELSLIGSDVHDWKSYTRENLPEIKFEINSFEKFYELATEPKVFIDSLLNKKDSIKIDKEDYSINIYKDINIIFGQKGSGKTYLINNYLKDYITQSEYKSIFHYSSNYKELYKNMIRNIESSIVIDLETKKIIEESFDEIRKYTEGKEKNKIVEFIEYYNNQTTNKNRKAMKKTDTKYSKNTTTSIRDIITKCNQRYKIVNKVLEVNKTIINLKSNPNTIKEQLNLLKQDIFLEGKEEAKKNFVINGTNKFLRILRSSADKNTGSKSKPQNIGFSKLVADRYRIYKKYIDIKNNLENVKSVERRSLGNLPNKGNVYCKAEVVTLGENERHTKGSPFSKNAIVRMRNIIKKINKFSYKDFREINQYFETEEKETTGFELTEEVIKIKSHMEIEKSDGKSTTYDPSEGEKAILSIGGILEDTSSYDIYVFDEIERGLGNKYITEYIIPKIKYLRDMGKTIIITTHNANIAINSLPLQWIYCAYPDTEEIYYTGSMYSNELIGHNSSTNVLDWQKKAMEHLEGNETMFNRRKNLYGL